ncbi:MAG: cell division protein FtsQ/DivIB, partial [Proteobacteria bacterium]|nr:cell division protein FtsQ/DivIB [Pseudomonadota bacterium]
KIAAVEENVLGEWQVKFTNDLTVLLGHEELLQRVERFSRVYRQVITQRQDEVDHIDARYGNGVAVSWRDGAHVLQLASASSTIGVTR